MQMRNYTNVHTRATFNSLTKLFYFSFLFYNNRKKSE